MRLDELLQGYREELEEAQAPDLRALFDEEPARRRAFAWSGWALVAAAASLALVFWAAGERREGEREPAGGPMVTGPVAASPAAEEELAALRPAEAIPAAAARKKARAKSGSAEVATAAFVALAEMEMLPAPRTYQVVTVTVDETRLLELGLRDSLRARDGRVTAQVLLGEDGIARAVRVLGEDRE